MHLYHIHTSVIVFYVRLAQARVKSPAGMTPDEWQYCWDLYLDPLLSRALFAACDLHRTNALGFRQFARALAVMTRGGPPNQLRLAFSIADAHRQGVVRVVLMLARVTLARVTLATHDTCTRDTRMCAYVCVCDVASSRAA